ncbi:MAG: hypothetical protein WCI73_10765 [Phycisphaerae bacterium]
MRISWQALVGISVGLLLAALIAGWIRPRPGPVATGPMLADRGGAIRTAVIQFVAGSDAVLPVYREFLGQLPAEVTVYAACPEPADFDILRSAVGSVQCQLRAVYTHHPMTAWSRDRWVALHPPTPDGPITLLAPRGESGANIWPTRAGDEKIAEDLGQAIRPGLVSRRSSLYFDGGDFLAEDDRVFIAPRVRAQNLGHTCANAEELRAALQAEMHLMPTFLENAPEHHVGMFMMAAGARTMLVADPGLARPLYESVPMEERAPLPAPADFSAATQARFDAVAQQLAALGYRVVRIPVVPAQQSRVYLTYVNVILDHQGGRDIVYLPIFRGAAPLNKLATEIWASLGYQVRPVDCTSVYSFGGTLHCLVNVLQRAAD